MSSGKDRRGALTVKWQWEGNREGLAAVKSSVWREHNLCIEVWWEARLERWVGDNLWTLEQNVREGKLKILNITLLTMSSLKMFFGKKTQWTLCSPSVSCHSVVSDSLWPHGLQHYRLPCPSPTPGAGSNSCPLSQWCHPTISSSVIPFSSCLQSFPASGSFPMSQFFASGGQSIGVSASASVLPMNIQDWFPLGWTGWISSQSKGLSSVFSNTTVQKHRIFGAQLSL